MRGKTKDGGRPERTDTYHKERKRTHGISRAGIGWMVSLLVLVTACAGMTFCRIRELRLEMNRRSWRSRFCAPEEIRNNRTAEGVKEDGAGRETAGQGEAFPGRGEERTEDLPEDPLLARRPDFKKMREINPEITAWICVPGTGIDEPVCRHSDDSFYLDHGPDGQKNYGGAVFLSCDNSLQDAHLVFYGHNMRSGQMFGSLKAFREESFFREHPWVYLFTPERNIKARIFSCRTVSAGSEAYRLNLSAGSADYRVWLEEAAAESEHPAGEVPAPDARCFTLSTCTGRKRDERYVIHAAVTESAEVCLTGAAASGQDRPSFFRS